MPAAPVPVVPEPVRIEVVKESAAYTEKQRSDIKIYRNVGRIVDHLYLNGILQRLFCFDIFCSHLCKIIKGIELDCGTGSGTTVINAIVECLLRKIHIHSTGDCRQKEGHEK